MNWPFPSCPQPRGVGGGPKGLVLCLFSLESGLVLGELRECMDVFVISIPNE